MAIFGKFKSIKVSSHLHERDVRLGGKGCSDKDLEKIAELLQKTACLNILDLSWNNFVLENTAGETLAKSLVTNATLTCLDLARNRIENEGARKLASALKVNQTLLKLRLEFNQIGDEGASKLADALESNHTLTEMNLGSNCIGIKGALKLASALKVNQALNALTLGGNELGARGATGLAEALKVNQTLQRLCLEGNRIGNEGAQELASALKVNVTLKTLILEYNEIYIEGARSLLDAVKYNSTIKYLNLSGNGHAGDMVFERVVSEIRNILWEPGRINNDSPPQKPIPHSNTPTCPNSEFYSQLTSLNDVNSKNGKELNKLVSLIADMYMLKFYYTVISSLFRSGLLSKIEASIHILGGLEKSTELCLGECEIADYKLILEKAEADGHIERRELFRLDNRAELKRIKNDPDIMNLMEMVRSNTARIEGLEANVKAVNNSVNRIRKGLKHKMKVEAAVGFLSATINAISFGVGGSIIDATAKALGSIVDFGDIVHIKTVAARHGDGCVEQVKAGAEMAIDKYADYKLEAALKKGNILTVVSASALMMESASNVPSSERQNYEAIGDASLGKDDFAHAIDCYSKALHANPSSYKLYSKRSSAYLKFGDAENALIDAISAIQKNQNYLKGYYRKGKALQALKRFEEADSAFREGLALCKNDAALQEGLERLHQDKGYKTEIEEKYKTKGNSYLENGNFAEAIECYTKAIALNRTNYLHFSHRSTAYLKLGDFENALEDASSVIELKAEIPMGYCLKGTTLHALKRFKDAIFAFEEGLRVCPNNDNLQSGLRLVKDDKEFKSKYGPGNKTDDEDIHYEPQPTEPKNSQPGSSEVQEVEQWLLARLPRLKMDYLTRYANCLVEDGFDSIDMLDALMEDDLAFMKKAHKRVLLSRLKEDNNAAT